jgi:hypothetical protein
MEKMKITSHKAYKIIEKVVRERGRDYVFRDTCHYQTRGSTPENPVGLCVVGKGLIDIGISFWDEDGDIEGTFRPGLVQRLEEANPGLKFTPGAIRVLQAAQEVQDSNRPYREVLEAAKWTHENNRFHELR